MSIKWLSFLILSLIGISVSQWDLSDYGLILQNDHRLKFLWGTYKPNLYFAMKNRRNSSHVFGLMWYNADRDKGNITQHMRHECTMDDNLKYGWKIHNGEDYGHEVIEDKRNFLELNIKYNKRSYLAVNNQTWDVLIEGSDTIRNGSDETMSIVLYNALENFNVKDSAHFKVESEDSDGISLLVYEKGEEKGSMKIALLTPESEVERSIQKFRIKYDETWRVKKIISKELDQEEAAEYAVFRNPKEIRAPNIIAFQFLVKRNFKIRVSYSTISSYKIISERELNQNFDRKKEEFNARFDRIFKPKLDNLQSLRADAANLRSMMQEALSNLLGGIGYYWGKIKVHFPEKPAKGGYHQGFRYALDDKGLFTGSPSRSFFARGFLWDEGFHNILISQWNFNITIDILDSWFSTMSATGYIAREQIRGKEQEAQVPKQFIEQDKLIANPPTFIFPIESIINHYKFYNEERDYKYVHSFLKKSFDKISIWYEWFEIYQKSASNKEYFQWQGRNSEHNLACGLDDFPRGMTSNAFERHLDLYLWVLELTKTLRNLSEIFDYELVSHFDKIIERKQNALRELYLDKDLGVLNDFLGPQFKLVSSPEFKRPVPPINWRGDNKCGEMNKSPLGKPADCNPYSNTPCCSEFGWCGNSNNFCYCPKCKKAEKLEKVLEKEEIFNPHIGYVTLYPLIFGVLKENESEFNRLLDFLGDEQELNSPYGIRSLSRSDLLYHTGDDYWRGNIWINLNFLTLRGLYKYYRGNARAFGLYAQIRERLVKTVLEEYKKSGMFYEQYSDKTGSGLKAHPFNGWTSLIVNIITEDYDVDIV